MRGHLSYRARSRHFNWHMRNLRRAIELNPLDSRLFRAVGQLYVSAAQVPILSGIQ